MASSLPQTETVEAQPEATSSISTSRKVSSVNKRKYDEAVTLLDDAAGTFTPTLPERPPPPKKARTSLYSTLAKYGIGTSVNPATSSSLSSLQKVLSRVKSASPHGVGTATFDQENDLEYPNYDPSSRPDFMARLQTFKLITYSSKPPEIDAVAAARCGWFNEGKEVLTCRTCQATWAMPPRQTTDKEELDKLIAQQKNMLIDQHKVSCPWKVRQSEASIYSMPIPSPSVLCTTILQRAGRLQPLLQSVSIKHPLSTQQVGILVSAINAAHAHAMKKALDGSEGPLGTPAFPDETSIIVGLFGWDTSSYRQPSTPSLSSPSRSSLSLPPSGLTTPSTPSGSKSILTCQLCQRQVGLWSFSAGRSDDLASPKSGLSSSTPTLRKSQANRTFDVLKEHRPHCPYIVKSTFLPILALPAREAHSTNGTPVLPPPSNPNQPVPFVEGWKALMSVLSRSQWRKAASSLTPFASSTETDASFGAIEDSTEIDQVSEIVKDVKSRHGGGRDLVRFIKGLLR